MSGEQETSSTTQARERRVAFRPLTRDDLPLMLQWLSDPDVAVWFEERELSLGGLERSYGPTIDGSEPVRGFIILIDGWPAGYIQTYVLGDHPDYLKQIELEPDVVSSDLFLGDPEIRNHGWGAPVLRAFHRQIVFAEMGARMAAIMPSSRNDRAIAAYRKAGFTWQRVAKVYDPALDRIDEEAIMLLPRTAFFEQDTGV